MPLTFAKDLPTNQIIHVHDALFASNNYKPTCPFCGNTLEISYHFTQTPYFTHVGKTCETVEEARKLHSYLPDHLWFALSQAEYDVLTLLHEAYASTPFHLNAKKKNDPGYALNKLGKIRGISYLFESLLDKKLIEQNQRNKYQLSTYALNFFGKSKTNILAQENTQQRRTLYAHIKTLSQAHHQKAPEFEGALKYLQKIAQPNKDGAYSPIRQKNQEVYQQTLHYLNRKAAKPNFLQVKKPYDDESLGKSEVFRVFGQDENLFLGPQGTIKTNIELKQHAEQQELFILAEMIPLFQAITQNNLLQWKQQKESFQYQLQYLEFLDEQLPEPQLVFLKNPRVKKFNQFYFFYTYTTDPYDLTETVSKYAGKKLQLFVTYLGIPSQFFYSLFNRYQSLIKVARGIPSLKVAAGELTDDVFGEIKNYKHVSTPAYRGIMIKKARDEYTKQGKIYGRTNGSTEDTQKFLTKPKNLAILKALGEGLTFRNIMDKKLGSDHLAKKVMIRFYKALYLDTENKAFAEQLIEEHNIESLDFFEKYKSAIKRTVES